ncbi:MAG: hypothetical protein R3B09_01605 [Nannocystaceae bacterium]
MPRDRGTYGDLIPREYCEGDPLSNGTFRGENSDVEFGIEMANSGVDDRAVEKVDCTSLVKVIA